MHFPLDIGVTLHTHGYYVMLKSYLVQRKAASVPLQMCSFLYIKQQMVCIPAATWEHFPCG